MSTSSSATMGSPASLRCNSCSDESPAKSNKIYAEVAATNAEPKHHSIYQPFAENEVSKNLAFHVLAATLHLVMMLRETADVSKQRNNATARVAELEAANETLSQEVQQHCHEKKAYLYEIERLLIQLNVQQREIEAIDNKCKELETMHWEKATLLKKVTEKLKAANTLIAKASEDLNGVDMEPEANDNTGFLTICKHCNSYFLYKSFLRNLTVICATCECPFLAREAVPPLVIRNPGSRSSRRVNEGYGNSAGAEEAQAKGCSVSWVKSKESD